MARTPVPPPIEATFSATEKVENVHEDLCLCGRWLVLVLSILQCGEGEKGCEERNVVNQSLLDVYVVLFVLKPHTKDGKKTNVL